MTFEQFAYFVASQVKKMEGDCNVHWRPFYLRCPYCDNKYDTFIGRMETFERDVRYVSEGLPSDPKNNLLWCCQNYVDQINDQNELNFFSGQTLN